MKNKKDMLQAGDKVEVIKTAEGVVVAKKVENFNPVHQRIKAIRDGKLVDITCEVKIRRVIEHALSSPVGRTIYMMRWLEAFKNQNCRIAVAVHSSSR